MMYRPNPPLEPTMVRMFTTRPLRFVLTLSVATLGIGCDSAPVHEPLGQREAPLEEAAPADHPDGAREADDAGGADDAGHATDTSADPTLDEDLTFEEQVERLMAESEAFREAVGTLQFFDTFPEGAIRRTIEPSKTGMTCNEPESEHELNRAPAEEVTGDPQREVPLLARLQTLKPGDLEPTSRDGRPEPVEP